MSDVVAADLAQAAEVNLALGRIMRALRKVRGQGTLTAGCASALGTIVQSGPMRLRDLAEAEGVTAPTMSRIVAVLDSGGHVVRTPDPTDARAALLDATDEGRELVNGAKSARIHHLARALDTLPEEHRALFTHALVALERELRQ